MIIKCIKGVCTATPILLLSSYMAKLATVPFHFSEEEYNKICENAQLGNIKILQKKFSECSQDTFGPTTFCPDPKHHVPSPVVLAAQYGQIEVVIFFLDTYGHIIDINHSATIISRTTKKKVHHATALWAACTGGHIDIVKLLVTRGADVNKTTLTRSTPLRGASFHGYINVMEYLLNANANINTPNCIGQSPLCIAAMRGEVEAVKFLIAKGADVKQRTINGYSVMHLAAAKGKHEVVKYLLQMGVSPEFQEANPYIKGYVPCPLFLAASTGQNKAVEVLLEHDACPPFCQADANLLLASMQCELRKRLRFTEPKIQSYWEEGLKLRQEHMVIPSYLQPIPEYNYRVEIKTVQELQSQWYNVDFSRVDVFYQSLLIRERCMGFLDQGLIYFLIRRGSYFCQDGRYKEAELLWRRAMKMEAEVCEVEISHTVYGHCEGIMRDLEKDLSVYCEGICTMLQGGYTPDFPLYIEYGLKELDILSRLDSKADSEIVSFTSILGLVMEIFLSWILHYTMNNIENGILYSWSKECHNLGVRLVSQYLFYSPGTTLLHLALTNFSVSESEDRHILDRFTDLRPLVTALLAWGANDIMDLPDYSGQRPIHIAAQLAEETEDQEILSPLLDAGAHLDAVNSDGNTVYELCTLDIHKVLLYSCGPLSLACCAARTVIKYCINYSGLPSHVQQFIKIHDSRYVL